jgi:aryl-alcohol dehydrogenase-like predicted oxidoreductase
MSTTSASLAGGTLQVGDLELSRFGYGAMQLAGPGVMGPPADPEAAIAVLREAVALGVTHIDTSEAYGPRFTNEVIREALGPFPSTLHVATKVGGRRDAAGGWPAAREPDDLRRQIDDNLETLGVDALDLVHLRFGGAEGPVAGPVSPALETIAELRRQGLVRNIGLSNVLPEQVAEARAITEIVAVQNMYNLATRHDDALIDELARDGIAYIPFFPLGGFAPVQADALSAVAARLGATPMSVALAWLLQRSPNILLIPGTSSLAHLRENAAGAALELSDADVAELDRIGR